MKKVKYLLGFLVVGIGLLFNQSFGLDLELVNPTNYTNFKLTFPKFGNTSYGGDYKFSYSFYRLQYNNGLSTIINQPYYNPQNCVSSSCTNYHFNNSIFQFDIYTGSTYDYSVSSVRPYNTDFIRYTQNYLSNNQLVIGNGNSYGRFFYCIDCLNTNLTQNPKFGIGGFINGSEYNLYSDSDSTYYRFIYTGSINLDSLDLTTLSGGALFEGYEYFKNSNIFTNYGRISPMGYTYKYFGSYGYGFSTVANGSLTNTGQITWNNLRFFTYSDSIEAYLKLMSANGQFILTSSDLSGVIYDGILTLPSNSYYNSLYGGQYLLSKDPNNSTRILYEYYGCKNTELSVIFSGNSNCRKLDAGYLTYSGSTSVLPFVNFTSLTGLNTSPLLTDLLSGSLRGEVVSDSNGLHIGNHIYGLQSASDVDIKTLYNNNTLNLNTSALINENIIAKCMNDFQFQMSNPFLCNAVSQNLSTPTALGSGYYYEYSVDENGNTTIHIISQAGLFDGSNTVWVQDGSGNWLTNCTGGWCNPNASNFSGSQFLSGDILTEEYYNGTGLFFACPYPYEPLFTMNGRDLRLGRFDILGPINCFISAFKHGKSYNFFDNVSLYDFGPLITGNSQNHRILFRFFDFLLIIGFVLFFTLLYKRFK